MYDRKSGIYSLRRMDLSRQDLFYPKPPRKQKLHDLQDTEAIRTPPVSVRLLPNPSPEAVYHKWNMDFFGLSENKVFCTEPSGRTVLYDARLRAVVPMPGLNSAKTCAIFFAVPNHEDGGVSLYVMEKVPQPRPDKGQLEAFVYAMAEMSRDKSWRRYSLPPPPYGNAMTRSYAVLGGGSHLCVSAEGLGTYCYDTAAREWRHAGDWMLPFYGKAEFVPELGVWFGISNGDGYVPCASDLSPVIDGEKPELCGVWKNRYPPGWEVTDDTQIVSLGAGRLCILDFVDTLDENKLDFDGDPEVDDCFAVLTGVELLPRGGHGDKAGNGNGKFRMIINHKSMIHRPFGDTWLEAVL